MILILLLSASTAAATPKSSPVTPEELFKQANTAYEAGEFTQARAKYERLLGERAAGPALAYNLGNTHHRLGARGQAILWYERARRLAPRDEDIRFNLSLARSSLKDEEGLLWETLDRVLTPTELPWVVAGLIWLLFGLSGTALWWELPWTRIRGGICVLLLLLLPLGGWWLARARHQVASWAVIVSPDVEVRSGPGDQYTVGATVPEGRRALILNRRPGWVEIGIPSQSLKGWVVEKDIAKI